MNRPCLSNRALVVVAGGVLFAVQLLASPARIVPCKDTCFLLEARKGVVAETSGHYRSGDLTAEGVEVVGDPVFGNVLRLGEKGGTLSVPDGGNVSFKDGLTVEAWIFLEKPIVGDKTVFAHKSSRKDWCRSSFELKLVAGNKWTLGHVGLEGEPIDYADVPGLKRAYMKPDSIYPAKCNTMNGFGMIPTGRWTRVAFTYNRARRLLRTTIDGGIDRQAFNPFYDIADSLLDDDDVPVTLFKDLTNARIAQVHLASRAVAPVNAPPVEVFVTELAYAGTQYVHLVPTDEHLPLPVEVVIQNIDAAHPSEGLRYTLSDLEPHNYDIPKHLFTCSPSDLVVRLMKDGRELYKFTTLILNAGVMTEASSNFCRGLGWTGSKKRPDWWIDADSTILFKERPFFPIMTCFVKPDDLELLAGIGFNQVLMRKPDKTDTADWNRDLPRHYARAEKLGLTLQTGIGAEGGPGEGFLRTTDEPWGYSFEIFRQRYMDARNARKHRALLPIYIAQNNKQRYRETGAVCDILSVDPYWNGRAPLRSLYDAVRIAVRETDGKKPVNLSVGSWGAEKRRPAYDELRTQCYFGLIGGARALTFYAWDDGGDSGKMPTVVADYRRLFKEFKEIEDALTVPNVTPAPTFDAKTRGFFACAKKTRGSKRPAVASKVYLIVASDLYRPDTRTMTWPAAAGLKATLVSKTDRGETSSELVFDAAGRAALTLPPLSAAVYRVQ